MIALWDGSLRSSGYGAPELRQYYQKYMSRSLVLSIALQIGCVATYYAFQTPEDRIKPQRTPEAILGGFPIPPSLFRAPVSSSAVIGAKSQQQPKFAIPIPVADPFVDTNNAFPTLVQLGKNSGVYGDVAGTSPGTGFDQTTEWGDDNIEPPIFRPIEKPPEIVKKIEPKYPEIAVRAGIEGTVFLNLWVDKMGRVRKAVVLRSDAQVLNSSAEAAAMQWLFTPAIMQQSPVSVWVTIPFRFKLAGK
jgi:protein TonB